MTVVRGITGTPCTEESFRDCAGEPRIRLEEKTDIRRVPGQSRPEAAERVSPFRTPESTEYGALRTHGPSSGPVPTEPSDTKGETYEHCYEH